MHDIQIATAHEKIAQPRDFDVEVRGSTVVVPRNVATALEKLRVHTAEEFVSQVRCAPSAFAAELGWNVGDVLQATERLVKALRGIVSDELLGQIRPRRRYGALNPSSRSSA